MKDAKEIAKEFMARFPLGLAQRNEYAIRFVSELIELVRKESKEQVITQGS